jgi:RHS repeat-associated protein
LHRDYLGSIVAISNQAGVVVEKRHFEAWGSLKNLEQNGVVVNVTGSNIYNVNLLLDRGYTGHEHLLKTGLIHMNGRLYDPAMHRFLQPDNYVQDPSNTQNYNRYGYVLNNPLKYTDPSGEIANFVIAAAFTVVMAAITYTFPAILTGKFTFQGLGRAMFWAAVSSVVSYGIGEGVSAIIPINYWGQMAVAAVVHGAFQGGITAANGGSFWNGFASGSTSSIMARLWQGGKGKEKTEWEGGLDGKFVSRARNYQGISGYLGMESTGSLVLFGAISGGTASLITGGNF